MQGNLPPEVDGVRQRLVDEWVVRPNDLDACVKGAAAIFQGFREVLKPMLGEAAMRAIFSRTISLVKREQPRLGNLSVLDSGLDVRPLRKALAGASDEEWREVLRTLVDQLFTVVHGLLGQVVVWLLPEVEAQMSEYQKSPCAHEEEK
jgi:hypothetical protein